MKLSTMIISATLALGLSGSALALENCPEHICNWNGGGGSNSVPEPATLALLGASLGALGLSALRRRKKKNDE